MINAREAMCMYMAWKPDSYIYLDIDNENTWRDDVSTFIQRSARHGYSYCTIEYDTHNIDGDLAKYLKFYGYTIEEDYEDCFGIRTLKVTWSFV